MVYEVETIKRQAKLRRSAGHGPACERRLSLWPMPYASLACDMTSASEVAVSGLRRSTIVICLCLCLTTVELYTYE